MVTGVVQNKLSAEILASELIRTMRLLGASDVSELRPQHVRLP